MGSCEHVNECSGFKYGEVLEVLGHFQQEGLYSVLVILLITNNITIIYSTGYLNFKLAHSEHCMLKCGMCFVKFAHPCSGFH
jgi:hypothetical protein